MSRLSFWLPVALLLASGAPLAPLAAQNPPPPPPPRAAAAKALEPPPQAVSVAGAGTISFAILAPIRHASLQLESATLRLLDSLATAAAADQETPNAMGVMKIAADSLGKAIVAQARRDGVRTVPPATVERARKQCTMRPLCNPNP